jgi:hypothetical protein
MKTVGTDLKLQPVVLTLPVRRVPLPKRTVLARITDAIKTRLNVLLSEVVAFTSHGREHIN